MKLSFFCLYLILTLNIQAQPQSPVPFTIEDPQMDNYLRKKQTATLNIRIINAPDTITKVSVKCTYVGFGSQLQSKRFYKFNSNGFLKIVLNQRLPYQQVWLNIEHYLYAGLYLDKGLNITIDAQKLKSDSGFYMIDKGVNYSGVDGQLNKVMNELVVYKQDIKNKLTGEFYGMAISRSKYTEPEFLSKFDSIYRVLRAIDNDLISRYPNFRWAIENELLADYYGWLCVAYWFDRMPDTLFKKIDSFAPYFTSNRGVSFYNYFFTYIASKKDNSRLDIDEQLYYNYSNYNREQRTILDSIKFYSVLPEDKKEVLFKELNNKKQELFQNEIEKIKVGHLLHLIDSLYHPPKSDILKTFLLAKRNNAIAETYRQVINSMKTSWCRDIISSELKQTILKQKEIDSLLAKGSQLNDSNLFVGKPLGSLPFNANLYRLDSIKNVEEFIVNLKSRFPNQALVIDFWATWCSPCLKELPVSKQLFETNKDLPVTFIYICTNSGSTMTVWKNKIAELQIPGTHFFADDKIVNELMKKFNSEGGFPTYIVIDVNGKLRPKAIDWIHYLDREKLKTAVGL